MVKQKFKKLRLSRNTGLRVLTDDSALILPDLGSPLITGRVTSNLLNDNMSQTQDFINNIKDVVRKRHSKTTAHSLLNSPTSSVYNMNSTRVE